MLHETDEHCVLHAWESIPYGTGKRPLIIWTETGRCECPNVSGIPYVILSHLSPKPKFYVHLDEEVSPSNVSPAVSTPSIRLAPSFLRLIFGFC